MGEVYAAFDQQLGERVALKTLRPDIAAEEQAHRRFLREVQLARRVTHPNICRIFDVFAHPDEAGSTVTFVTMELLEGETLKERLNRVRRLAAEQALPIVRQVAAALAAAHDSGIVHRDLKSSNVMLVESPQGERAVVTDFGIAKTSTVAEGASTETVPFIGTIAYMAPEQVEGAEVTSAADVYALGVLIYEMVTGAFPFHGDTALATALQRLRHKPPSPRRLVPDLHSRWESAILRCLEVAPKNRFASSLEVSRALEGPGRLDSTRRVLLATTVLVLLLGVARTFLWNPRQPASAPGSFPGNPAPRRVTARPALAVLGFKNLSERADKAWLSTALAEMMTTELAAGGRLRIVPGESVARMKLELELPESEVLAADTLTRIYSYLGTDLVVVGSYFAATSEDGDMRIDLRLQDTTSGEVKAAIAERGSEAELLDFIARFGAHLRGALGIGGLTTAEAEGIRVALPSGHEAVRLYAEGLRRLRVFDALAARRLLEEAAAAAPQSPLVRSALATAWSTLGYDARAEAEAERAFELADELPREERALVEGRFRAAAKQWAQAVEIYRTLWERFPDNLDYGLRLMSVQSSAGQGGEALDTLKRLREHASPATGDPRIDLAEAEAAYEVAEYERCRGAAGRAADKGEARGAKWLTARARRLKGRALRRLGEFSEAQAAGEQARRVFAEVGDRAAAAHTLTDLALVAFDRGDIIRAEAGLEEALMIFESVGQRSGTSRVLNNLASAYLKQGDLANAGRKYLEAADIGHEVGSRLLAAGALANLGFVLELQGHLDEALERYTEALTIARDISSQALVGNLLSHIAEVHESRGELDKAEENYREAIEIERAIGHRLELSTALRYLGNLQVLSHRFDAARESYRESLAIQKELGAREQLSLTLLGQATLAIEEDDAPAAERLARPTVEVFRSQRLDGEAAMALVVLSRSLVEQNRLGEARQNLDRALALAGGSESRRTRLTVGLVDACLLAAAGRRDEGLDGLEGVLAEARDAGLVGIELEARLELGKVELAAGRTDAGRRRLSRVEQEARSKGFELIAAKCREVL